MLRKIYRELVRIRKELHAIRSDMEFCDKSVIRNTAQTATSKSLEVKTNVDDKPTADCAVNISEVLNDLTNRRYQGV
ncbi:MAG: hypothetical protein HFG29_09690 [Eubacterium sp.]|nr:hypothetical protein [Eubacterium sp.]